MKAKLMRTEHLLNIISNMYCRFIKAFKGQRKLSVLKQMKVDMLG